jgi:glycerate 2-kinase
MTKVSAAVYAITLQFSSIGTTAWTSSNIHTCLLVHRYQSIGFDRRCKIANPSFRRYMIAGKAKFTTSSIPISPVAMTHGTNFTPRRTPEEIRMTDDIKSIIKEAIHAVDPVVAVQRSLKVEVADASNPIVHIIDRQKNQNQSYPLGKYSNIIVVGIGKAASSMVSAALEIISPVIDTMKKTSMQPEQANFDVPKIKGIVLTKQGHVTNEQRDYFKSFNNDVILYEASHPIPCEVGVSASYEIMNLVSSHSNSLVFACISGGGSALFCTPKLPDITLQDIQATNAALLQTGWPISTMNIIRTVLEHGKGGGLAFAALRPPSNSSEIVSFLLSDVVGDPIDIIASGPTVIRSDAAMQRIVEDAYEMMHFRTPEHVKFPKAVVAFIKHEYEHRLNDTIDNRRMTISDKFQTHCYNCLVGNNALAVEAAAAKAHELGYHPIVLGTQLQGEASTVAQILTGLAQNIQHPTTSFTIMNDETHSKQFPVALIAGGETTVTLPTENDPVAAGRVGGRNQELALAAAIALQENRLRQIVLASVGTDGNDGPTDAAGAIIDGGTVQRLLDASESSNTVSINENENSMTLSAKDALQYHNAYPYLSQSDADNHSPLLKV